MKSIFKSCALGLAAFALVAVSAGCKMTPEEKVTKITNHISRRLDLNETQKTEFRKLAELAVADFETMTTGRKALANELEKQIVSEKADTALIKKLVTEQAQKRTELSNKWIDQIAEFHGKLSPEQKQKALRMMKKFRDRFEAHFAD